MQRLNDPQNIKPGFQFKNNSMQLTVVHFYGTDKRNLALLMRLNDACPYITVRDLSEKGNGDQRKNTSRKSMKIPEKRQMAIRRVLVVTYLYGHYLIESMNGHKTSV